MAALSRSGAIIIVTVLSCAVLGAVWGAAIYLLPQSDTPSESIAITPVPHPLSQSSPFSPVQTPPRPDPAVPPVPTVAAPSVSTKNVADRLQEIEELHDRKLLTDPEYQAKRAKLIAAL